MKYVLVFSMLAAVLGGCAIVPAEYGDNRHAYQERGYSRGDGYYQERGYRGDSYYRYRDYNRRDWHDRDYGYRREYGNQVDSLLERDR